jgi:hypothetical protein
MRGSQSPADIDAIDIRQSEIEDHQVDAPGGGGQRGPAGRESLDRVSLTVEHTRQPGCDRIIVLDQKD